jgi:dTDP-4-dehydrorhamnose reductase
MRKGRQKVLILGGNGLLGSHCHSTFSKDFDTLSTYNSIKIDKKDFIQFSFNSFNSNFLDILGMFKPDYIINTAGLVSVDGCERDELKAMQLNSFFLKRLIHDLNILKLNKTHLIQLSTPGVYGNSSTSLPWKETDSTNPISIYAETKLLSEFIVEDYQGPFTIIRSDFYGINPYSEKSLLWWIVKNAKKEVEMDGWQNIYFNPISARKLAQAIRTISEEALSGTFNIGCSNSCNKYDFVENSCKYLNLKAKVKKVDLVNDKIRPNYSITDCSKFFDKTGFHYSWEEDLSEYMTNLPEFPLKLANS